MKHSPVFKGRFCPYKGVRRISKSPSEVGLYFIYWNSTRNNKQLVEINTENILKIALSATLSHIKHMFTQLFTLLQILVI